MEWSLCSLKSGCRLPLTSPDPKIALPASSEPRPEFHLTKYSTRLVGPGRRNEGLLKGIEVTLLSVAPEIAVNRFFRVMAAHASDVVPPDEAGATDGQSTPEEGSLPPRQGAIPYPEELCQPNN